MSVVTHIENIKKAEESVKAAKEMVMESRFRQRYHFMPPAFWMNDPNGFIYFKGKYHIFYQYNPYSPAWGPMHWGHAVSEDLFRWEHLPIALAPSETYDTQPEGGGCFSGSAVDNNGTLTLIYTATTDHGEGFVQTQCVATSDNGVDFVKYEGNPVITSYPESGSRDFRDPKVWRHGENWYMVLGSSRDGLGKALLYKSKDLYNWDYINVLAESRGEFGKMWECPDVFRIDNKDVIMFSPMYVENRKTIYLAGELDYKTGKLNYTTVGEVDWGFDAYAPQSMMDDKGRRILIAWANNWDWMPWYKDFGPTDKDNWCGALTLPRKVELDADGLLKFIPVEEIENLRGSQKKYEAFQVAAGQKVKLEAGNGVNCEINATINVEKSTCDQFSFLLRVGESEFTKLTLDLAKAEISFDRNNADRWSQGICRTVLREAGKDKIKIRIFIDTSSIEVYTDNYKTVLSMNVFPKEESNEIYLCSNYGTLAIDSIETYEIKPVW